MTTKNLYIGILALVLLPVLLLSACEDLGLKKDFNINTGEVAPRLAIHASIDALDSVFYISIAQSQPVIGTFVEYSTSVITQGATIDLFENGTLILHITEPEHIDDTYASFIYATRKVPITPSKEYRLTVAVKGFETVSSTVTAPQFAQLGACSIDTSKVVSIRNILDFTLSDGVIQSYASEMYPCKIEVIDLPNIKNYYLIELLNTQQQWGRPNWIDPLYLGTNNRVLAQENPQVEAYGILTGEIIDLFLFDQMIISDLAFSNASTAGQEFFTPAAVFGNNRSKQDWINDGYAPEDLLERKLSVSVRVRNLTREAFRYYRSVIRQGEGSTLFTEPVSIESNVEHGFGCFSISSSASQQVLEHSYYEPGGYKTYK